MKVNGEVNGLKNTVKYALSALYDLNIPKDVLWTTELLEIISRISCEINREIAVYIDRKGQITNVSVGKNDSVDLSPVEGKRSANRLSGIRCIHTHPSGSGQLSSLDISSLKLLQLDAMIAVGVRNGHAHEIYVGILTSETLEELMIFGPLAPGKEDFESLLEQISDVDKELKDSLSENQVQKERAIIVGLQTPRSRNLNGANEAEVSLAELEELAKTAGAIVVGQIMQKRDSINSSTVVGRGKIDELRRMVQTLEADVVIFDEELTGTQQRNIEAAVGQKVLSRTSLILDIFAQRARSREGILQVELAQMEYRLPRLMGMGLTLSRLGGGIGTRGPGETKLETDRRTIRKRIVYLKEQLADIRKQRGVLRSARTNSGIPVVSLVGYTNAGKSTLLNALCQADVFAEDKLFATLDTTTRQLLLNDGSKVLLTDTVGFIRRLPHGLLDAFKSTLEEVTLSDLILIIADASDPHVEDHVRIVKEILLELGASHKPTILVLNKTDKLENGEPIGIIQDNLKTVEISAEHNLGLDKLKDVIQNTLFDSNRVQVQLAIPFANGALLPWLHSNGKVLDVSYNEESTLVDVILDKALLKNVTVYLLSK